MPTTSCQVHMSDDLTTANSRFNVARIADSNRTIAFVYVDEICLYVESLAQFDEILATLTKARDEWIAVAPKPRIPGTVESLPEVL